MLKSFSFFAILFMLCLSSPAPGNIIQVPSDTTSIQGGIHLAGNGDTVLVAEGTYYENITFLGKAITVASLFIMNGDTNHINNTIINGSQPANPNAASVVTFESGEDTTSVLSGFTITAGTGKWYATSAARVGGGIYCYNSGCKIIANKIINNSVTGLGARGGGMGTMPFGSNAYVVLKNNQIENNIATANTYTAFGGGVWLTCHAEIDSNLITYNSCISDAGSNSYFTFGGGICCYSQPPYPPLEIIIEYNTITHNSVSNNSIPSNQLRSAGVSINGCNGRMTRNEISYNEIWNYSNLVAGIGGVGVGGSTDSFLIESNIIRNNEYKYGTGSCYGGGLQAYGPGTTFVVNNLIEGNFATHGGGVVVANNIVNPGKAVLVNNTIVNNTAVYGGGIYVHESTAQVMNSIIWGNQASTGAGIHTYNGSIDVVYSDVQGGTIWPGTGNINVNPELVADSISSTSPCISEGVHSYNFGGGTICYCPGEDMNKRTRPYPAGSNPDMGAWESKQGIVGIEQQPLAGIPNSYDLFQNYPNPFNPVTTLSFQLSTNSFVSLKVYDLTGREVAVLVSDFLVAGSFKYEWNASGMPSGVYFYQLEVDNFKQTRKMLLVR